MLIWEWIFNACQKREPKIREINFALLIKFYAGARSAVIVNTNVSERSRHMSVVRRGKNSHVTLSHGFHFLANKRTWREEKLFLCECRKYDAEDWNATRQCQWCHHHILSAAVLYPQARNTQTRVPLSLFSNR